MARLPGALKRKEAQARLLQENLARLSGGEAAAGSAAQDGQQPAAGGELQAAPEQATAAEQAQYLRSRLSTVEGMLRAESDRHRMEQAGAQQRETELQQRLHALERERESAVAAAMSADDLKRYVTAQQLQEFGEDHCRLIVATVKAAAGELTRGAVQQEVAAMRAELAQQRTVMERSQEAAFWAAVNAALPRWREVNADAGFLRWLGERDVLAGRTRQEVLNEARSALDADRVVAIFNAWTQSQARNGGTRDASRRVIPNGKPPAALPAEAPGEQAVSRGWIAEQNRLYSQGYYRRRQQEWQGVQETIDRAAREGRIR